MASRQSGKMRRVSTSFLLLSLAILVRLTVVLTVLLVRESHGFSPATAVQREPIAVAFRHSQRRNFPLRIRLSNNNEEGLDKPRSNGEPTSTSSLPSALLSKDPVDPVRGSEEQQQQQQLNWTRVREQFALFREMATPYYQDAPRAKVLLGGVLVLTLANSGISVLFSYVGKDFWNALSAKDVETFGQVLGKYVVALSIGAPVATLYHYQREQLAVHWREWMTARTFDLYVQNKVYYNLQLTKEIDNPDQRIAEDVRTFTSFSLSLLITILTSVIDLCSFSTILWSIYPQLFVAIILYAGLGTLITAWLGRSLVHLNFRQLRAEADLRYSLVRLRDNAESIAFYAGEDLEGQGVEKRVEITMDNRRQINAAQRNLEFFTNAYRYLVQILPVAVVAPRYFAGAIELGVISQSAGAFNHILSDLSIIVNQFEQLSTFSAGIDRLSSFYEAMRTADPQRNLTSPLLKMAETSMKNEIAATKHENVILDAHQEEDLENVILLSQTGYSELKNGHERNTITLKRWDENIIRKKPLALSIQNLDLFTPDGKRMLIRNLSLDLRPGEHLLIVGNSGAGKSSLLRAIAGLWTTGNGRIERPEDSDVYFLPQRPYCTVGSLKDQLLYPSLEFDETEQATVSHENTVSVEKSKRRSRRGADSSNKILPRSHLLKQALTDQDLLDVLEKVNLLDVAVRAGDGDAARGLTVTLDWSNILSLGEQQRLAFGRLLVNRPKLVIVDEATSALDMAAEARMYSILQEMAQRQLNGTLSEPGLTYISVGHRPSLVIFHDKKLRLGGDTADHELERIEKSVSPSILGQQQTL